MVEDTQISDQPLMRHENTSGGLIIAIEKQSQDPGKQESITDEGESMAEREPKSIDGKRADCRRACEGEGIRKVADGAEEIADKASQGERADTEKSGELVEAGDSKTGQVGKTAGAAKTVDSIWKKAVEVDIENSKQVLLDASVNELPPNSLLPPGDSSGSGMPSVSSLIDSTSALPTNSHALHDLVSLTTKGVLDHLVTEATNIEAKLCFDDVQVLVDYLDLVLDEDAFTATDLRNRILTLLSRIAVSTRIYPQRHILKPVEYGTYPVAEGGFGDVYQALGGTVCVKVMKRTSSEALKSYVKELILWSRLSHPNILPFFGIFHSVPSERMCLVSPWMKNGNLSSYTANLPQKDRIPLLSDVADGLAYLHELGIVHSDIKGQNVLVSDSGRALITDFGASHIATDAMKQGITQSIVAHSAHFAAPEVLQKMLESVYIRPNKACDIWSFGCLCYEIMTRRIPFHGQSIFQIFRILCNDRGRPSRPGAGEADCEVINNEMWALMIACWVLDPYIRPNCQDIRRRLRNFKIYDNRPMDTRVEMPEGIEPESKTNIDFVRVRHVLLDLQTELREIAPNAMADGWTMGVGKQFEQDGSTARSQAFKERIGGETQEMKLKAVPDRGITPDDIIIVFIGATGTGKSTFVDLLVGQKGKRSGNDLESVTHEVEGIHIIHPDNGKRVVLVDTPGLDDVYLTEGALLKKLEEWLVKTYKTNVKLSGIVYLHSITDRRMGRSSLKNLRIFGRLCGETAMQRVILVTTMWKDVDPEDGRERETQLIENFWQPMLGNGAMIDRLEMIDRHEAWRIADRLIDKHTPTPTATSVQGQDWPGRQTARQTIMGKALRRAFKDTLPDRTGQLKGPRDQKIMEDDKEKTKRILDRSADIEDNQETTNDWGFLKIMSSRTMFSSIRRRSVPQQASATVVPSATIAENHFRAAGIHLNHDHGYKATTL